MTVSTGIITTIAGTGAASYSGDNGQATSASMNNPEGIAIDSTGSSLLLVYFSSYFTNLHSLGNLYIADLLNHRVRKVTVSTGIITTIAGSSTSGSYSGDNGPATAATLNVPNGVAIDTAGNIYIADYSNHRIRKVTVSTGIITTIAGTGTASYSGDNGPATSATLCGPSDVALGSAGISLTDFMFFLSFTVFPFLPR